jgi:microcystin-dependent protein
MADIVDDLKVTLIEITSDSGINLSGDNPRIKHTGDGCLTVQSTSSAEPALKMTAPGGFEIEMEGRIDIDTTDDGEGINIGTNFTVPVNIGTTENLTTVNGDLTVEGNFIVNGDSVQHNITVFDSEDPLFYLNKSITISSTNTKDIGFIGERGNQQNIGWFWSESNKEFSAVGIVAHGDDSNDIISPINNYKPVHCGGLKVETDTSNGIATICDVQINGKINLQTTSVASDAVDITSSGGVEVTAAVNQNITLTTSGSGKVDVPGKLEAGTVFQDYQPSGAALLVPTGAVMPYAGSSAPGGWLLCNGQSLSTSTYSTLFAVIGYTYGGAGANFTVPDLRSRMPLGAGAGAGLTTRALAATGGQESISQVPPHTHNITDPGHKHKYLFPVGQTTTPLADTAADEANPTQEETTTSTTGISINNTGTNIAAGNVDVMNPFLVLNYIIKV